MGLYFVIITANNCGHCTYFKGNSSVFQNPTKNSFYTFDVCKKILKDVEKEGTIIIVNVMTMTGDRGDNFYNLIDEFSFLNFKGEGEKETLVQRKYKKVKEVNEDYVKLEITGSILGKEKENFMTDKSNVNIKWYDFIRKSIPYNLCLNVPSFPSFKITTKKEWLRTIEEKTDFIHFSVTSDNNTKEISFSEYFVDEKGTMRTRKDNINQLKSYFDIPGYNNKLKNMLSYSNDFIPIEKKPKEEIKKEVKKHKKILLIDNHNWKNFISV
jgi:hypothetical protein